MTTRTYSPICPQLPPTIFAAVAPCPDCESHGYWPDPDGLAPVLVCETCDGHGWLRASDNTSLREDLRKRTMPQLLGEWRETP